MRDFSSSTRAKLAKLGIYIVGAQAAPAFDGDDAFSGKVYAIDVDGCRMMRNHSQVLEMAR